MNKTAIKNFAIWARNKLIADITYKAGLMGISEKGINPALPQSTKDTEFYDIGTKEPYSISGDAVCQRRRLVELISQKAESSDDKTAYHSVIEEVAYTWFNRLIAVRFMEVNNYLPSHIRVLSSDSTAKLEPDMVTTPFEAGLELTDAEKEKIIRLKNENQVDDLFRLLFIKQCNALNGILPNLFEKTADYSELLLNVSVTDQDGVVYHLVHDIDEDDFQEAVEIIGWLYQYYNDERKNEVINIYKGMVVKEDIPAATQLFTTDWVVRYMVDNSLGRYWIERNFQSNLAEKLAFFVTPKDGHITYVNEKIDPTELTFFDPCMGSGHILVYAFDVLMEIYRECGYSDRDAAESILQHNLYGLDIDNRAYQIAYFAVMMRARKYNRRALNKCLHPHIYPLYESYDCSIDNDDLQYLMDEFKGAQQYGSLIRLNRHVNLDRLQQEIDSIEGQISFGTVNIPVATNIIKVARILMNQYCVVCTNPPYLNKMNPVLKNYVLKHYKDYSGDLFSVFMFKNFDYCKAGGYSAFMTPFVWMFIKTYEQLRKYIIEYKSITTLVQMEYSAFEEATVPICSFVLKNGRETTPGMYFKLSDFKGGMDVQKQKVLEAVSNKNCRYFYETSTKNFSKIPGSPIAYWASRATLDIFEHGISLKNIVSMKAGLSTGNNEKYMRLWYEVNNLKIAYHVTSIAETPKTAIWIPCNSGGKYRKWGNMATYVVDWENNGYRIRHHINNKGKIGSAIRNENFYFRDGLTWNKISSSRFGIRNVPIGFIFDDTSRMMYMNGDIDRKYILALLCSSVTFNFLSILSPTLSFTNGELEKIPVFYDNEAKARIIQLVNSNIQLSISDWDSFETSWDFEFHPLLRWMGSKAMWGASNEKLQQNLVIAESYAAWNALAEQQFLQLKSNEEELNRIFIDIYGLRDELTPEEEDKDVTVARIYDTKEEIPESMKGNHYVLTKCDVIKSFISYAVGCMLGRYSLDVPGLAYAGGDWDDSKYSSFIPDEDNILPITDEEYFEDDIVGLFCAWLKKVYGEETLEENLDFIAKALGNKGNTSREVIRNYFLNDFFKDHCSTYSVTGSGKRPIYWLFDSGKQNGFKALIYMHRYDENTIGNLRIDYLHRMERVYENEIARMQDTIDNSQNVREVAAATKRKEKLQKQIKECKEYDEKIAHLALSRIAIDLDDGVKVNYEKVQTDTDGKKYDVLAKI